MAELTIPKEDNIDWNALGQVIDTTFVKPSMVKQSSYSVKMSVRNDKQLLVSYTVVVNFGSENEKVMMKRKFEEESLDIINDALKKVKKEYKDITGSTITMKEVNTESWIEVIGLNPYSPRRTAYFRRKTLFDIS